MATLVWPNISETTFGLTLALSIRVAAVWRRSWKRMGGWVRAVVFEPLRMSPDSASENFRLYWGRSNREAPSGPFSFVPCRPYGVGEYAFPRPGLRLPERWITPNLRQGAKATRASQSELRELWDEVIDQVVDKAGLALGVQLDAPPQVAVTPPSDA